MEKFTNIEINFLSGLLRILNDKEYDYLPKSCSIKLKDGGKDGIPVFNILHEEKSEQTIIWIRGTRLTDPNDAKINMKCAASEFQGGLVHEGYKNAALEMYKVISPYIKEETPITCIGHSLGGAVASVLTMVLKSNNYNAKALVFGVPPVFSEEISKKAAEYILTIINSHDLVPKLGKLFNGLHTLQMIINSLLFALRGNGKQASKIINDFVSVYKYGYPENIPGKVILLNESPSIGSTIQNYNSPKDVLGIFIHPFSQYHLSVTSNIPKDNGTVKDLIDQKGYVQEPNSWLLGFYAFIRFLASLFEPKSSYYELLSSIET